MIIDAPRQRKKKPMNYDAVVNLRLDSHQLEKFKEIAEKKDIPYQKLIRKILDDYIDEHKAIWNS